MTIQRVKNFFYDSKTKKPTKKAYLVVALIILGGAAYYNRGKFQALKQINAKTMKVNVETPTVPPVIPTNIQVPKPITVQVPEVKDVVPNDKPEFTYDGFKSLEGISSRVVPNDKQLDISFKGFESLKEIV